MELILPARDESFRNRLKRRNIAMISDTVQGAIYLSIIDMILLIVFLILMGQLFKLFPLVNKIRFFRKKG